MYLLWIVQVFTERVTFFSLFSSTAKAVVLLSLGEGTFVYSYTSRTWDFDMS